MKFYATSHTDVGIVKKTNQDSVLIQMAETDHGTVLFAMICDGMGGLSKGELASAYVIRRFREWFQNRLRVLMYAEGISTKTVSMEWDNIILDCNKKITEYGEKGNIQLGTTVNGLLMFEGKYYIVNVGDSRTYEISDSLVQITKDQTYIQKEMDAGRMTYEQAMKDPQRNVLLQCVGASEVVVPEYYFGDIKADSSYMLCSDGFRHLISKDELFNVLAPGNNQSEDAMTQNLTYLTELNKYRQESDNISSILIRVVGK